MRDILHVLAQRWPLAQVRIYSAQVQGEAAPGELIGALQAADRDDFADLILLAAAADRWKTCGPSTTSSWPA